MTAFKGAKRLAASSLDVIAPLVKQAMHEDPQSAIVVFSDETGEVVQLDLRGSDDDIKSRYSSPNKSKSGPGRPKLGVVAREVTLLPRHWEWLSHQPGGASVTLRQLVDATSSGEEPAQLRGSHEPCRRFIETMAGKLQNVDEAIQALANGDRPAFQSQISSWPMDVQIYAFKLAESVWC